MSRCICCGKEFKVGDTLRALDLEYTTIRFCDNNLDCALGAAMLISVLKSFDNDKELKKEVQELIGQETTLKEFSEELENLQRKYSQ